jgi:hypothetical protein
VLPAQALQFAGCNRFISQSACSRLHFGCRLNLAEEVIGPHDEMARAGVSFVRPLARDATLVCCRCADPGFYAIEVYGEAPGAALN